MVSDCSTYLTQLIEHVLRFNSKIEYGTCTLETPKTGVTYNKPGHMIFELLTDNNWATWYVFSSNLVDKRRELGT